ncbi:MAG: hypothetical protein VX768_18655 [Planctomycetota bacterium]|nr:hypothetical protein [Planctomycetota bacterium]
MTRILITPTDDRILEGSESLTLRLLDGPDYRVGGDSIATIRILDNERKTIESIGEVTRFGSHDTNFHSGYYLDDQWETVSEQVYAGGNRTRMDHVWNYDLSGEENVVFKGRFNVTSEADQDDFRLSYSTDGNRWYALGKLDADSGIVDIEKSISLPAEVSQVQVRLYDRFRKNGDTSVSTVAVDMMHFESVEETGNLPPAFSLRPGISTTRLPGETIDGETSSLGNAFQPAGNGNRSSKTGFC